MSCSSVLFCYLKHEAVPDLGPTDVLAVGVADAHGAGGRRTRVGDRPRRRQHRHVEAVLDGLHARLVDAADAVGLRLEGDELGMLLDHQDEVCLALEDKKELSKIFFNKMCPHFKIPQRRRTVVTVCQHFVNKRCYYFNTVYFPLCYNTG
jgi:hypothetical protein